MKRAFAGSLAAVAAAVELPADAGDRRIQLFPQYGTWRGRNGAGPYTLADKAHAERVIAATAAAQGSIDLMVDYDHQAPLGAVAGVGGKAPAAGWIKPDSIRAEDDGVWAEVDYTAAAASAIAAKEYRYSSPYFLHDKQGRITRIVNVALVNIPNFNMAAVASGLPGDLNDMDELAAIAAALGLPAGSTLDQAVAAIGQLKTARTVLTATASALGLAADADQAAIATAIATRTPDPAQFVPMRDFQETRQQLGVIMEERADAAIASAIGAGKLTPGQKEWATGYYKSAGAAAFASFIGGQPVILQPGARAPADIDLQSDQMTADEHAIASALGLTPEKFLAARKEGVK